MGPPNATPPPGALPGPVVVPPPGAGPAPAPGVLPGLAPTDAYGPGRLREAFDIGGPLSSPMGFISLMSDNSLGYRGLEQQIRRYQTRVRETTGDELRQATARLAELEGIQRQLTELANLDVRRPDFAEAGGKDPSKIGDLLAASRTLVEKMLSA